MDGDDPVLSFEVDADWSKFDQELSRRESTTNSMKVKIVPDMTFGNENGNSLPSPTGYRQAFNDETGRLRIAIEALNNNLSQKILPGPAATSIATPGPLGLPFQERGFTLTPRLSLEELPWRSTQVFHGTYASDIDQFRPFSHFGTREAANHRIMDWSRFGDDMTGGSLDESATTFKGRLFYRNMYNQEVDSGSHTPYNVALELEKNGVLGQGQAAWIRQITAGAGRQKAFSQLSRLIQGAGYDAISYINSHEDSGSTSFMNTFAGQVVPWSQAEENKKGIRYNKPSVTQSFTDVITPALPAVVTQPQGDREEAPRQRQLPNYSTYLSQRSGRRSSGGGSSWNWGDNDYNEIFEGEVVPQKALPYYSIGSGRQGRLGWNDVLEGEWEPYTALGGPQGGGGAGSGGGADLVLAGPAGYGAYAPGQVPWGGAPVGPGGPGGPGGIPPFGGGAGGIPLGPLQGPQNLPFLSRLGRGIRSAFQNFPRAALINGLFGLFEASRAARADEEMSVNAAIATSEQQELQAYNSGINTEFGGLYGSTIGAGLDLFGRGPGALINQNNRTIAGDALTRQSLGILLTNQAGAAYRNAFTGTAGTSRRVIEANFAQRRGQDAISNQADNDQAGFLTSQAEQKSDRWTLTSFFNPLDPFGTERDYALSPGERAQRTQAAAALRDRAKERGTQTEFEYQQAILQYNNNVEDTNIGYRNQDQDYKNQITGMSSRDQALDSYRREAKEKLRLAARDLPETVKDLQQTLLDGEKALIRQLDNQDIASTAMKDASVKVSELYGKGYRREASLDSITETALAKAVELRGQGNFVQANNVLEVAYAQRAAAKVDQDRQIANQQNSYGYGTAAANLRMAGKPLSGQIEEIEGARKNAELNMDAGASPQEWKKMEEYYMAKEAEAKNSTFFARENNRIALTAENQQLNLAIDRPWDSISPEAIGIGAQGKIDYRNLLRSGDASAASLSLQNSILKERALKAKYLDAFTGSDEDLRSFDQSNYKTQDDPSVSLKSIDDNIATLKDLLGNALNNDTDDGNN